MNNKLDFKDPNNHITYYEISDNQEQIIVHFKSGKSFSYPYSKEQEENILNMMKEQTNDLKEEKYKLQERLKYWNFWWNMVARCAGIMVLPLYLSSMLYSYNKIVLSDLIFVFVVVIGVTVTTVYDVNKYRKRYKAEIERIELLEDIMDPELLKEKEYNKSNILANTSNKMKTSQSTKTDYTKNELINEMSRLAYIKNLKDLRTMVENIQYTNMLSKEKEKTYIKK